MTFQIYKHLYCMFISGKVIQCANIKCMTFVLFKTLMTFQIYKHLYCMFISGKVIHCANIKCMRLEGVKDNCQNCQNIK